MKNRPPKFARRFLRLFINKYDHDSLLGDFDEMYYFQLKNRKKISAHLWYWRQVFRAFPIFILNMIKWSLIMFKNHFKITFRQFKRQKGYSFINISGLAIGLTCCILILLWVQDELSYDKYNTNHDQIYRICINWLIENNEESQATTPPPLANVLKTEYPEVQHAVRLYSTKNSMSVRYKKKTFNEDRVLYADPDFFRVFSIPLVKGDTQNALLEKFSIVITEETAKKYFGDENPIGKILNFEDKRDYIITGVSANVPEQSHFHFDFLASFETLSLANNPVWLNMPVHTYVLLKKNSLPQELETKFPGLIKKYVGPQLKQAMGISLEQFQAGGNRISLILQPITAIHLHSNLAFELETNADSKYIYIFSLTAIFVLIIAVVNFINLSTAKSAIRAKEVGIRKVLGSNRRQLIVQFLTESTILTFLAILLSIILVRIILPSFNNLSGKNIEINLISTWILLPGIVSLSAALGILSGCYPAFHLTSYHPIRVIKGIFNIKTGSRSPLRSGLVTLQFIFTIILIIGTFTVYSQLKFINNRYLGFDKEHILVFERPKILGNQQETLKNTLLQNPDISAVSSSRHLPGRRYTTQVFRPEGSDPEGYESLVTYFAEYDFSNVYQLEMISGRFFSKDISPEYNSILLNEAAVNLFTIEDPVGKKLLLPEAAFNIIGVIKDFNYAPLHEKIQPMCIRYLDPEDANYMSVRIRPENINNTIQYIEDNLKILAPSQTFNYYFLDQDLENHYKVENRTGKLFTIFSFLAIFVACLGLSGLASFISEQRTKEIGVRKVLGASLSNILKLLSKEYFRWILISNIIAWPLAYYMMNKWLQNFAYRTSISISLFFLAGLIAVTIAVITVSYHSIKAATVNPVDSLRNE
ncbi:ABC transporter permease [candidate division KSB1 bacterium]